MDKDLKVVSSEEKQPIEIDIRKILEQIGLDRNRWPEEWRERIDRVTNG